MSACDAALLGITRLDPGDQRLREVPAVGHSPAGPPSPERVGLEASGFWKERLPGKERAPPKRDSTKRSFLCFCSRESGRGGAVLQKHGGRLM